MTVILLGVSAVIDDGGGSSKYQGQCGLATAWVQRGECVSACDGAGVRCKGGQLGVWGED